MSSRGRGISNTPAWMERQQQGPTGTSQEGSTSSPKDRSRSRSRSRSPGYDRDRDRDPYGRSSRKFDREDERDRDRDRDRDWDRGGRSRHDMGPPSRYRDGYSSRDHRDGPFSRGGRYDPYGGGPSYRGGGGHRGKDRDYSRRGGPRRGGYGGGKNEIQFQSAQEEREWVEERRRKRLARKSLFDVPPTPEQLALEAAALVYQEHHQNQMKERAADGFSRKGISPSLSRQPQQTRHARRLYIGQLPVDVSESEVHAFFNDCIKVATGKDKEPNHNIDGDNDPILSVYINRERRFAFVEFRTMEICSACLALDGINVLGKGKVKIKRPNDYNPAMAPEPSSIAVIPFDVSRLGIVSGSVPDGPNKIFIGGLPYHLTEDQVMELLSAFGQVKAFHLVKADPTAVTSKGYCFVEYADPNVTAVAVMGLNGMAMGGDKVLSARMAAARGAVLPGQTNFISSGDPMEPSQIEQEQARARMTQQVGGGVDVEALLNMAMDGAQTINAIAPVTTPISDQTLMMNGAVGMDPNYTQNMANAALDAAFGGAGMMPSAPPQAMQPTKILVLLNMVTDEDLATEQDYADLFEEVKEECAKFGNLISMKIPRPQDGYELSAVKKIFLEYSDAKDAEKSMNELAGRAFGANVVQGVYFSEQDFYAGKLK